MERFIWLLSLVPARVILVLLGGIDLYMLNLIDDTTILEHSIWNNNQFLEGLAIIVSVASIVCAFGGGWIGFKYVEMGRSRRWHYRANKFDDYNGQLRNTLYWAGKMASFPIIIVLICFLAWMICHFS